MQPSRREKLEGTRWDPTVHTGLWLDKYQSGQLVKGTPTQGDGPTPQSQLVTEVALATPAKIYAQFFERWQKALEQIGAETKRARVQGRLAIGLGDESVLETSITLHRTYGNPFIPGSALKGLVARYAHKRLEGDTWRKGGEAHKILFGNTTTAGYVTFFDALYVPGTGHGGKALWPDVITVHHPNYYQGNEPPADWDSPTPIPFLSATGDYLVALGGDARWVETAFEILRLALKEEGVGAKTSSGYGRMRFTDDIDTTTISPGEENELYAVVHRRLLREETPPPGRFRGTVATVKQEGNFGFINPATGGGSHFVHKSQLRTPARTLQVGQVVEYEIGQYKGKDQAQNVDILLDPQ